MLKFTGIEVKYILEEVIAKTKKSIEREGGLKKELTDDRSTLMYIQSLQDNNEPFPDNNGYDSYTDWKDQVEKEIKSGENSLSRIETEKAELIAFEYFVENAPEV
ncbi:hypothetical protein [Cetobacterium sp.]|uniref:hypothetical protein n=1 Tax=Cetobacterium sp. TaxID=2071632 RepID=UPI003F3DB84D